jgi:hypothetical protein
MMTVLRTGPAPTRAASRRRAWSRAAAILAVALFATGCPRPAPVRSEPPPAVSGRTADVPELQRRYAWLSDFGFQERRVQEIIDGLQFDSISLQRTACYGTCPIYQVVLRRDLSATYQGERFVSRLGAWHAGVPLEVYGRLSYLIERLDVMAMDSSYSRPVTDLPTSTLRIWPRGAVRPKAVSDYANAAPPEVRIVMSMIDGIVGDLTWTRSRPPG